MPLISTGMNLFENLSMNAEVQTSADPFKVPLFAAVIRRYWQSISADFIQSAAPTPSAPLVWRIKCNDDCTFTHVDKVMWKGHLRKLVKPTRLAFEFVFMFCRMYSNIRLLLLLLCHLFLTITESWPKCSSLQLQQCCYKYAQVHCNQILPTNLRYDHCPSD